METKAKHPGTKTIAKARTLPRRSLVLISARHRSGEKFDLNPFIMKTFGKTWKRTLNLKEARAYYKSINLLPDVMEKLFAANADYVSLDVVVQAMRDVMFELDSPPPPPPRRKTGAEELRDKKIKRVARMIFKHFQERWEKFLTLEDAGGDKVPGLRLVVKKELSIQINRSVGRMSDLHLDAAIGIVLFALDGMPI